MSGFWEALQALSVFGIFILFLFEDLLNFNSNNDDDNSDDDNFVQNC